jgi:hypothetical protein
VDVSKAGHPFCFAWPTYYNRQTGNPPLRVARETMDGRGRNSFLAVELERIEVIHSQNGATVTQSRR